MHVAGMKVTSLGTNISQVGWMCYIVLSRVVFYFQSADGVGGCEGYGLFLKSVMWIDVGVCQQGRSVFGSTT